MISASASGCPDDGAMRTRTAAALALSGPKARPVARRSPVSRRSGMSAAGGAGMLSGRVVSRAIASANLS
jgi:hypothetical protein